MSIDSEFLWESSILFAVKKTTIELARDRGFDISEEKFYLDFTLEEFRNYVLKKAQDENRRARQVLGAIYVDAQKRSLFIMFALDVSPEVGISTVKDFLEEMKQLGEGDNQGILISSQRLSPPASDLMKTKYSFFIQHYLENYLTHNPTQHFLVPKYEALTSEQKRDFIRLNRINVNQMPTLSPNEANVRYYGWRPGTIVQITRVNLFSPEMMVRSELFHRYIREN